MAADTEVSAEARDHTAGHIAVDLPAAAGEVRIRPTTRTRTALYTSDDG